MGENHHLLVDGLLEDSFVFIADLIRKIDMEMVCCFTKVGVNEWENRPSQMNKFFILRSCIFAEWMLCW